MLVVSWHFDAAAMCEFSREEFVKGMTSLGCDSAEQLRRALPRLRAELNDSVKFKVHSPFCVLASVLQAVTHCVQFGTYLCSSAPSSLITQGSLA